VLFEAMNSLITSVTSDALTGPVKYAVHIKIKMSERIFISWIISTPFLLC
jgi:hypothetical protein